MATGSPAVRARTPALLTDCRRAARTGAFGERALPVLAVLLCVVTSMAEPSLRTPGVHLIDPDGGAQRWLGPGGQPAWLPDSRGLILAAAHGPLDGPPFGPLYRVDAMSRAAAGLSQNLAYGCPHVSPSGALMAVLTTARGEAALQVVDTAGAKPLGSPVRLGPLRPELADAFAWLPGDDRLLLCVAEGGEAQVGLFLLDPLAGTIERRATGAGGDGVWPSPDGSAAAVRVGGQLAVVPLTDELLVADGFGPAPEPPAPRNIWNDDGSRIDAVRWQPDGTGVWLALVKDGAARLAQRNLDGGTLAHHTLPGEPLSPVALGEQAAWLLARVDGAARLLRIELADGTAATLATVADGVPLEAGGGWPAPRPALSPDSARLAVSLGRTDRWGITDSDILRVPDTTVSGRTVTCTRRGRNVGASGVVFDSAALAFAGRGKPAADSPVVGDTRPGGFRWQRPSPPRWVVLHHTATNSDAGSLNALTSNGNGKISQLYADITPGRDLPGEPGTISVHYLVRRDGTVVQLVEERYIARHAGTGQWRNSGPIYDFNVESIGIEIVSAGNDYTAAQIRSVGRLVGDICRRNAIPLEHIAGTSFVEGVIYHKDFAAGLRGKPDPAGWPWSAMMAHAR